MTDKRRSARPATFFALMDAYERQLLTEALEQALGNEAEEARALGLPLSTLQLKLERLDVDCRKLRAPGAQAEW